MNKEPALVILSPGFPADESDTTCLPAQQHLARQLRLLFPGIHLIILALQYPYRRKPYLWNNVSIMPFGGRNRPGPMRVLTWWRARKKLHQLHRSFHIIGVLSWWYGECAHVGHRFAKHRNIPHYTWLFGQDARKGNRYANFLRLPADRIIALSEFLAAEFQRNYKIRPAHIIHMGIDTSLYPPADSERNIDLLAVGSLIPLKRYELFIRLVQALSVKQPSLRAVLCGSGEQHEMLAGMVQAAGLQDRVVLTGELPYAQVLACMQRSRLFIHPSSYEGFGMVCLEALNAGATVISFCNPAETPIPHWYVVSDLPEMIALSEKLLRDTQQAFTPVLPYTIADTARSVMQLFHQSDAEIS